MNKRTCIIDECGRPHEARGYCNGHYKQHQSGRPLIPLRVPMSLAERLDLHTDKTGDCWVWTGAQNSCGYGSINVNGKVAGAHRIAYELVFGPIPEGKVIDHMCHTPTCVNPDHLRVCTNKQNLEHRLGAQSNSKSGIRGVSWYRKTGRWYAQVRHNRVDVYTGYFDTIEEAEAAVIAERNKVFTHNDADRA